MTNITLSVPEELHKKMKSMPEIRWSEIARHAIEERINDFEVMNKITSKSKITQKDIDELSKKIKSRMAKKFYEYNRDRHKHSNCSTN